MKKLLLISVVLLIACLQIQAQGHLWTGAIDTDWHKAGNWTPAIVPNSTHHVFIPSAPANQPKITGAAGVCNSFTLEAGASLTIQATSASIATLTTLGNVTISGQLFLNGYFVIGTNNPAKLIAGNVIWNSSSSFSTSGFPGIDVNGNWTFAAGSNINMGSCSVNFIGNNDSEIFSNSATSQFGSLYVNKTSGAKANINYASTSNLRIFMLNIQTGQLNGSADITTIVSGHFNNSGGFKFYQGTVSLQSTLATQQLQVNPGDFFNHLTINGSATVTLNNDLEILGNFTLLSGTFNPNDHTIKVWGNWSNIAGPDYFIEGQGKVIFFYVINKSGERDLYDHEITHSEHFNILEVYNQFGGHIIINNPSATVSCNQYSFVSGGIKVLAGTFTALDLLPEGICGYYELASGGTINLTDYHVDLNGTVVIHGGEFNVYGEGVESFWPFSGNASLTMSDGVLDFHNNGIYIQNHATYTFESNISGGTFRINGNFYCVRSDFQPTGGTLELYGHQNVILLLETGNNLHHLLINKPSGTVTLNADIAVTGNLNIESGTLMAGDKVVSIGGNLNKNTGIFNKGTSRVIFQGNDHQFINSNFSFYTLEIDAATIVAVNANMGTTTCEFFDWTSGIFEVKGGSTFIANNLSDPGIYGNWVLHENGTIHLNSYSSVDLNAGLVIWGGEFNIWGGSQDSRWTHAADAHIFMQGGVLSFHDQGIIISDTDFDFTHNITGGIIRTTGAFQNTLESFTPSGGAIELFGPGEANISSTAALHTLIVDKIISNDPPKYGLVDYSRKNLMRNSADLSLNGDLIIESGGLEFNTCNLTVKQNVDIRSDGWLRLSEDSKLMMFPSRWIAVRGELVLNGTGQHPSAIKIADGQTGYYTCTVLEGGSISANHAHFSDMHSITVSTDGLVDPENAFTDCVFENGFNSMLSINNDQNLVIRGAQFPSNSAPVNVSKVADMGMLLFVDAAGPFAGEAFEADPWNRIHWSSGQPGLWTGIVSKNWHDPLNWDDGMVPDEETDVYIPAFVPNYPEVKLNAVSANLLLEGELAISSDVMLTVNGTIDIHGHLLIAGMESGLTVYGVINWHENSTADVEGHFKIYGHWNFLTGSNAFLTGGYVNFYGAPFSAITCNSDNAAFNNICIYTLPDFSTEVVNSNSNLVINGSLSIMNEAEFYCFADITTIIRGSINFFEGGVYQFTAGSVIFESSQGSHFVKGCEDCRFENLIINSNGIFTLFNEIIISQDLTINAGYFTPRSESVIYLGGNLENNSSFSDFTQFSNRFVFNGFWSNQFIHGDVHFDILEINKPEYGLHLSSLTSEVSCNLFDYRQGFVVAYDGAEFTIESFAGNHGIVGEFVVNDDGTINFYNPGKSVDINAELRFNGNGQMNVFGGTANSVWGNHSDVIFYMDNGVLDFKDVGIHIPDNAYSLWSNITGGTIRTTGDLISEKSSFNPDSGEIEFYGEGYVHLKTSNGSALHNLKVNKPDSGPNPSSVTCNESAKIKNSILIEQGLFDVTYGTIECNQIELSNGGRFSVISGTIKFENNGGLLVGPGGILSIESDPEKSVFTGIEPDDYYYFTIEAGGHILAENAIFENMNEDGINIQAGANVNQYYAFTNCWFRDGKPGPASVLLTIDCLHDLLIKNAVFFENTWGGDYNVRKTSTSGNIVFSDASGLFAGEAFEDDPNNQVHWLGYLEFEQSIDGFVVGSNMSHCFDAFNFLSVSGLVVHEGGDASLIAGQRIRILPGSHFHSGSTVRAYITTTFEFCEQPLSMMAAVIEEPLIEKVQEHDLTKESFKNAFSIRAFPNPTKGQVTIDIHDSGRSMFKIEIFNIHGERVLLAESPQSSRQEIDLTAFSPGIYFARLFMDEGIGVVRILKQ